ncbi:hypothetical protein [Piscirickettsia litoralis]|uniref:Uncharacterized protein n=1 Tax=Piscirickettsia litoralis TaxID=1891921 RepID=A0ABX2ZYR6_9GAMM|nr:hypothetical protein [Piscirickettsia litoralis]ODN41340.1 hypothetical protein BGC07_16345 [Piscirickettsia litoralis]
MQNYSITPECLFSVKVGHYLCRMSASEILESDVVDGLEDSSITFIEKVAELEQEYCSQLKQSA